MAKRARQARSEQDKQARQDAILKAALDVFIEKGFAAARLEDVAGRAGVAKGTVYLYFDSKEALFEALVRQTVTGPIGELEERFRVSPMSAPEALKMLFGFFSHGVMASERKKIISLVLVEAPRFPRIAEFYHREVISRALRMLRALFERAPASSDFDAPELQKFPHLIIAPALLLVIWDMLFERIEHLDGPAMIEAHFDLLMRASKGGRS